MASYYVNALGSNEAPFDTKEKGATSLYHLIYELAEIPQPGDIIEVTNDDIIIEPPEAGIPYRTPVGVEIRAYAGKPTIFLRGNETLFIGGSVTNIKFLKDGNDGINLHIGQFVANIGDEEGNPLTLDIISNEFKYVNPRTDFHYIVTVPVISSRGPNCRIINNSFINPSGGAISIDNGSSGTVVLNNTVSCGNTTNFDYTALLDIYNFDPEQVTVGLKILNNVLHSESNVGRGLRLQGDPIDGLIVDNNDIFGVTIPYDNVTPGDHNILENPIFFNKLNPIPFLSSPCLGAGASKIDYPELPDVDYNGVAREDPMDIGCFEVKTETYFYKNEQRIITRDTDEGRINADMTMVATPRKVMFYAKTFRSGRESDNLVHYTLPFTLHIPAGNGSINGTPVSWGSADRTVPANSFSIVYVDNAGLIHIIQTSPMEIIKDSIVLAYVNTGLTAIVYVENVEKTGKYIYCRKQNSGGDWGDTELVMNTGDQPRAFYYHEKIYLSYRKDNSALLRIFDLAVETTFSYLPNTYMVDLETMRLKRDPESTCTSILSKGNFSNANVENADLFPMGLSAFCFINNQPYVFLPFVIGDFISYIKYPYYIDIYTFDGESYNLSESVAIYDNINYLLDVRWHQIYSYEDRYFRFRVDSNLIKNYETPVEKQIKIEVFPPYNEDGSVIDNRLNTPLSKGNVSEMLKTNEYDETRDLEHDHLNCYLSKGNVSEIMKTAEYDETKDLEHDHLICGLSKGSLSEITITS